MNSSPIRFVSRISLCSLVPLWVLSLVALVRVASAQDGFTEPFRTVEVAAPESGLVQEVLVREGTQVAAGQPLARLDVDLHEALLAIAAADKDARGRVSAAEAEVDVRRQRLRAIEQVRAAGHASQEELDRAAADLKVAEGRLAEAREALALKELEHRRIQVQIERRTIRAPLRGIVIDVLKEPGEFIAPNDPVLFTVVQLDPLIATFDVLGAASTQYSVGDEVEVRLTAAGQAVGAIVDYISPVMDAESSTVAVRVRIPNPKGELQSGQACQLLTP